jgi:hypothetical protein
MADRGTPSASRGLARTDRANRRLRNPGDPITLSACRGRGPWRALVLALTVAGLAGSGFPAGAQEGHPLKGSWLGTWGPSKYHANDVLLVLNWDGKAITGMINPGTDNIPIKNASLNPEGWLVHLEADAKDKSGAVISYTIDGKIEGLAFHNRSIVGAWKSTMKESGAFKVSRQ